MSLSKYFQQNLLTNNVAKPAPVKIVIPNIEIFFIK